MFRLLRPRKLRLEVLDQRVVHAADAFACTDDPPAPLEADVVALAASPQAADPGNKLSTAKNLGTISRLQVLHGRVGGKDPGDMFKFTVAHNKVLKINLSELQANADVAILNSRGRRLALGHQPGIFIERPTKLVGPGTYYVQVIPKAGPTSYRLSIFPSNDIPRF